MTAWDASQHVVLSYVYCRCSVDATTARLTHDETRLVKRAKTIPVKVSGHAQVHPMGEESRFTVHAERHSSCLRREWSLNVLCVTALHKIEVAWGGLPYLRPCATTGFVTYQPDPRPHAAACCLSTFRTVYGISSSSSSKTGIRCGNTCPRLGTHRTSKHALVLPQGLESEQARAAGAGSTESRDDS